MAITVSGTSITFNDATVQTTAATGGFSGATVTSSAVDITLTSSSTQTQAVSMTASGKFVILPNATTLSNKGGPVFIIQNKGQNPFGIKDAAGNVIAAMVYYGQSVSLVLLSNAASAGTWGTQVTGSAGVAGIGPINASAISSYPGYDVVVCGLSSTQALIAYTNSSGANMQVVLATISGSTVTYGTPTTLTTPASLIRSTCALSSTLGIFFAGAQLFAVSVSGSTITVGAGSGSLGSLTQNRTNIFQESATAGAVVFSTDNGATATVSARGFTVSGTTITLGTTQNLYSTAVSSNTPQCSTAKLATGSYVSIYADPAAAVTVYARPWTSSAGTVTLGTQTTYANTTRQFIYIPYASQTGGGFGASSTCGVFSYAGFNVIVVISGSTISSTSTSYGPPTTFGGTVAYGAAIGTPQPFGTIGMIATQGTELGVYTGSSNGWGGGVYLGSTGLISVGVVSYSYCDATTNLYAGEYNGLVAAVVVKGN